MEKFPDIAKARLAAQRHGPHPDAEQLSAFSENALGTGERESVLAHLATCVDCRDIVGLAAAGRPSDAAVAKPARGGFRWATFQWASVAASVAIVTIAVLVVGPRQPKREQPANETAQLKQEPASPAPAVAPSESAANEAANRAGKSALKAATNEGVAPRREADAKLDRDSKPKAKAESGYVADGVNITDGGFGGIGVYSRVYGSKSSGGAGNAAANDEKKQADTAAPAAKSASPAQYSNVAPSPRQTDSLAGGRIAGENRPAPATVQAQTNAAQAPPAPVADKEELQKRTQNEIGKDQQPTAASVAASTESVELSKARVAQKAAKGASATSAGIVSTRFDSGTVLWRIASGHIQSSVNSAASWQDRNPAKDVQWTAVAALGQQIWVGGKSGAVWVSRDAGQSWAKVSLTGDDIVPLGDVTSIKIANPLLADVLLGNGDDWQTTDGGKSFRLLPKKP